MLQHSSHALVHPLDLGLHTLPCVSHGARHPFREGTLILRFQLGSGFVADVHTKIPGQRHRADGQHEAELAAHLGHGRVLAAVEQRTHLEGLLRDLGAVHIHEYVQQIVEPLLVLCSLLHDPQVLGSGDEPATVVVPGQGGVVEPNAGFTAQGLDGFEGRALGEQVLADRRRTAGLGTLVRQDFRLGVLVQLPCFPYRYVEASDHGGRCDADGVHGFLSRVVPP